nr:hypothetical protein [Tanacetum cinerariifolium]
MTTTTIPPSPSQPQQSTADPTLMKRIDELEQHMANLLQYNLALEKRLEKHGSRLYKLENLNIPHQVSKAVDEIVTDAVDWAMQAPLRARFSDLPAKKRKRRDVPRTPSGPPPPQAPPPPPPAGASSAPGTSGASRSSQFPPPPPPLSTGTSRSAQQQGSKALNDSILDEQVHLSDDEDSGNDHLPTANSRKVSAYETPAENSLLAKTRDMTNFLNWYCRQVNKTMLTPADLEGQAYEVVNAFYPDFIYLQF